MRKQELQITESTQFKPKNQKQKKSQEKTRKFEKMENQRNQKIRKSKKNKKTDVSRCLVQFVLKCLCSFSACFGEP